MDVTINVADTAMDGQLHLPEGVGAHPAVLLCPGLTRDIAGLGFIRDALLKAGFAVMAIRYRGMDLPYDDEDAVAALDYLTAHESIDADRLAMAGHSRGSMVSLRTAAKDARVKAACAVHPVTDFLGYVRASRAYAPARYDALVARFGGADPDTDPTPYERYAAINYADRIKVPTLLIAGTADMHSPVHHSVLMRDALVKHGHAETRLEIIEGSGHFFEVYYGGNCREATAKLVVDWISSHV
jgi:dipeptidyl aminopeptidase/acylaminoacyl peptidase